MKICSRRSRSAAMSLIDVMIVIATLALMATFFLVAQPSRAKARSKRITCVNQLKQVRLSFRLYAGDHNDQFPMNVFTNGQLVVLKTNEVYQYFSLLQNELGTSKVLICPQDTRKPASDFSKLKNTNISYFVGLDGNANFPESILAGDCNITNGAVSAERVLNLTTNRAAGFTSEMHNDGGNIALGDGSVQLVSSARLNSDFIPNTGLATNRILLP